MRSSGGWRPRKLAPSQSRASRLTRRVCLRHRGQVAALTERLADMRSKMKLWAAESRIFVHTDAKILQAKVDALVRQVGESESVCAELQRQIRAAQASKQDLHAQLGQMVHVSELHAARTEAGRVQDAHDELAKLLRSTQAEAESLRSRLQVSPASCQHADPPFAH